jgi:predicted MFS family arabinose efflux permease
MDQPLRKGQDVSTVAHWSAVFSLSLSVTCLLTAELLPISLLTPIASDLDISEGMAGQAVTATAVVAFFASLLIANLTRNVDRRAVMLVLMLLFVISNVLVGLSTSYGLLMAGRVVLGISLGGFWSMAAALAMRLVPEQSVARALSVIFGGGSVALAVAAPAGTDLGDVLGWRAVFLATAALGCSALVWQFLVLPSLPPRGQLRFATLLLLLKRRLIVAGVLGMMLGFGGHFAFFTYLRPFLEQVTNVDAASVTVVLFAFGAANVLANVLAGPMIALSLRLTLSVGPLLVAAAIVTMAAFGSRFDVAFTSVALWGLAFGAVPIAWTTWLSRTVPEQMESASGLQVAAIQLAITSGAGFGGALIDVGGVTAAAFGSAVVILAAAAVAYMTVRTR